MSKQLVSIIMGSDSDLPVMQQAAEILEELGIEYEMTIVSAHRTPKRMFHFAENAHERGIKVIIAGAGGAARRRRPDAAGHRRVDVRAQRLAEAHRAGRSVAVALRRPAGAPRLSAALGLAGAGRRAGLGLDSLRHGLRRAAAGPGGGRAAAGHAGDARLRRRHAAEHAGRRRRRAQHRPGRRGAGVALAGMGPPAGRGGDRRLRHLGHGARGAGGGGGRLGASGDRDVRPHLPSLSGARRVANPAGPVPCRRTTGGGSQPRGQQRADRQHRAEDQLQHHGSHQQPVEGQPGRRLRQGAGEAHRTRQRQQRQPQQVAGDQPDQRRHRGERQQQQQAVKARRRAGAEQHAEGLPPGRAVVSDVAVIVDHQHGGRQQADRAAGDEQRRRHRAELDVAAAGHRDQAEEDEHHQLAERRVGDRPRPAHVAERGDDRGQPHRQHRQAPAGNQRQADQHRGGHRQHDRQAHLAWRQQAAGSRARQADAGAGFRAAGRVTDVVLQIGDRLK